MRRRERIIAYLGNHIRAAEPVAGDHFAADCHDAAPGRELDRTSERATRGRFR
jgi:hypothetical protein